MILPLRAVVAIPVCNEEEHIAACLKALAVQTTTFPFGVLLFVNNTTDATLARAGELSLPFPLRVLTYDGPITRNAGWARRQAMEAAAGWLREQEPAPARPALLTTDADSIVAPDWIERNLEHLDNGICAVAGALDLDADDARSLPRAVRLRGVLENCYESLLVELESRLRPAAHDPWPRHRTHSGASLAATLDAYDRAGGMPEIPKGEDRAFVAALMQSGAFVRHDLKVRVVTSGRLVGRAVGGAADALRYRSLHPNARCEPYLERVWRAVGRVCWPRRVKRSKPVRPSELPVQIALAWLAVCILRSRDRLMPRATSQADIAQSGLTLAGPAVLSRSS